MKDIFGLAGLGLMSAGLYGRFGWELAAIIAGTILLALAVIGAMRQ